MKHLITRADIMEIKEFAAIRSHKRQEIIEIKKDRRLSVGPEVTLYFENYETMWWQIHEMLYIEKGGERQIDDELRAYNPLIPQGKDLTATLMIEIEDSHTRALRLRELTHIEKYLYLRIHNHRIPAVSKEKLDRTTEEGKTSALHFLHFFFTPEQINAFCQNNQDIVVEIDHPCYAHKTLMPEPMRYSLSQDFTTPA